MNDIIYNGVILGDVTVGKTSILNRLIHNSFNEEILPTIGPINFSYSLNFNSHIYKIDFNDIPGEINYINIMPIFFRTSNFALVVFDLTEKSTFDNVKNWIDRFREYNIDSEILIIGNKSDSDKNIIPDEVIKEKVKELGFSYASNYLSVSAKTNSNINLIISCIGEMIETYSHKKIAQTSNSQNLTNTKGGKCCK